MIIIIVIIIFKLIFKKLIYLVYMNLQKLMSIFTFAPLKNNLQHTISLIQKSPGALFV